MRRISPFGWIVLGVVLLVAVLLLTRQNWAISTDLTGTQIAQLIFLGAVLVLVVTGFLGRGSAGRTARYALIWAVIVVVLLVGYTYRDEISDVAQRVFAEVVPGQPMTVVDGEGDSVIINRARGSTHFIVVAEANNAPLRMLVDTGASVITLTTSDARLAGIETRSLRYEVIVATANGQARAAPVTLNRVAVGDIEFNRVVALVAEEGALEMSLLGLNFLNALSSYTVTGDQLVLTP